MAPDRQVDTVVETIYIMIGLIGTVVLVVLCCCCRRSTRRGGEVLPPPPPSYEQAMREPRSPSLPYSHIK